MEHFRRKKGWGILAFLLVFAGIIAIVMCLWNLLLPDIFGFTSINYWQAGGLTILARLLFGGFGKFHHGRHHGMHHLKREEFADFHDKVKGMSWEERREFIRKKMDGLKEEDETK
jgi:hypothetical protein